MKRPARGGTRWLAALVAAICIVSVAAVGATATQSNDAGPCTGTVTDEAGGMTVISVQGAKFTGEDSGKKPAKLVGIGPGGEVKWVHKSAADHDVVWGYDVDPMANGNLFVTATVPQERTVVYEFNPRTQERVWHEEFDLVDTHDADLIDNGSAIAIANMRNADPANGTNDDRLLVYNRTQERFTWEWRFDEHYDPSVGGEYSGDWTHVNDIDAVGDDQFIVSPRNFDQVLVVNRTTKEIDMKLGSDGDFSTLRKQHNPDYLESEDGTPTILVADSDNDRIVEYAKDGDGWERTWELGNSDSLHWPRDADRLENGNTLVTDSRNHRVVEVTPRGEVVWEAYSPWLVYDAVRVSNGEESAGPTMTDQGATGTVQLSGSANKHENPDALAACAQALESFENPTPGELAQSGDTEESETDGAAVDGTTGSTTNEGGQAGFGVVAALVAAVLAVLVARRD